MRVGAEPRKAGGISPDLTTVRLRTGPEREAVPAEGASQSPVPVSDSDSGSGSSGPLVWFIALGIAVVLGVGAGTWVMRKTR